jgi:hypothetical protein
MIYNICNMSSTSDINTISLTKTNSTIKTFKVTLSLILFIEVPVPSHERERSCVRVLGVSILAFYNFAIGLFRQRGIFCFHLINIQNAHS